VLKPVNTLSATSVSNFCRQLLPAKSADRVSVTENVLISGLKQTRGLHAEETQEEHGWLKIQINRSSLSHLQRTSFITNPKLSTTAIPTFQTTFTYFTSASRLNFKMRSSIFVAFVALFTAVIAVPVSEGMYSHIFPGYDHDVNTVEQAMLSGPSFRS
jgi:hypothetical protein